MSNWKIYLYINPDDDFCYERLPGFEVLCEDHFIVLDATPDNIARTSEQLLLTSSTVDTKDYLKEDLEPALREVFTDMSDFLLRELQYHNITGSWIDASLLADFGNQSVECAITTDNMIDYDWPSCETALAIWYAQYNTPYKNEIALLNELLDRIENGYADDFDASSYEPGETGWNALLPVVEQLPEYDKLGNRIG